MRNPNGYGSITKLSGKRRKPWVVRITTGYELAETKKGHTNKQIRKPLGYYKTRQEAMVALAEYNKDNPSIDERDKPKVMIVIPTFKELVDKVSDDLYEAEKRGETSTNTIKDFMTRINRFSNLYDIHMNQISISMIEDELLNLAEEGKKKKYLMNIKGAVTKVMQKGIKDNVVNTTITLDSIKLISVHGDASSESKEVFTPDEIKTILSLDHGLIADTLKIMLYTGMRISELLKLPKTDVHLSERYLIGGSKTEAGKNRVIPIHKKIIPIIERMMNYPGTNLVSENGAKLTYSKYYSRYKEEMKINKMPHEARHTFISRCDTLGLNHVILKKIVGHKSSDVTIDVYTHKGLTELIKFIDKFDY